jgi:hypothetical protein
LLKKPAFNLIRKALHPDTCNHVSVEDRNRASQTWEELKTVILDESDAPTHPRMTLEDLDREREKVRKANSERAKAAHARARARREAER